ncbi:CPBP family glutamic-type intramembrane protease [Stieleria sp. JC731]|uniref:CPBP family intramembrane glutamic endopeptidase n=1 Tax=Pirellulaceae TaxID=2691357 RepID=UPI001E440810|nr:type II CAAX endopeptidase family protein [Stieleria sp. JC731]MCC9601857.1 CPBP family glutamic-type intramembrane protease [Stieleria sp. JC731]
MESVGVFDEQFFRVGYFAITGVVIGSVIAGSLLWIAWLARFRPRNLCGDKSPFLVTRLPQSVQRWSVADFFVMLGMIIVIQSIMNPAAKPVDPSAETTSQIVASETESDGSTVTVPAEANSESPQETGNQDIGSQDGDAPATQPVDLTRRVASQMVANAGSFAMMLFFLFTARDATPKSLSLVPHESDFRRGLVATVWILAPVLIINIVVSQLVPYKHSVTDLLAERNNVETFFALLISAAFVTPIVEEFWVRLLLQGGLQKLMKDTSWKDSHPAWSYSSVVPVLVSSTVFAVMHRGQGAAPIPLFFFAMGLGIVYQRTGRLWIVIVVHMLLNGATICSEFLRINSGLIS